MKYQLKLLELGLGLRKI